ncbi:class I SAM-dependent methyltransferase [Candidatus Gracilibacteria bacterium]|nr:class I SAM-dependent methyltransferase [Candidatus Gracilibacteria bacterium]
MIDFLLVFICFIVILATIFFGWILWGTFFYGVPLVPTPRKIVRKMILLANLCAGQKVYDLGCGTGTILFAIPSGVWGVGYDLVKPAIWYAKIENFLLRRNLEFECADFFHKNLSDADVIFCYLFRSVMDRFYHEKFSELKKGCRIISYGFPMEEISPTKEEKFGKVKIYIYLKK